MLSALDGDRTRAVDIDAEILDLERSLFALRNEKALLQHRLDSYKYPVLTLPNEIVSEIFIHFLPIYPFCPPLTGILSPNLLTQICRRWREIALATPGLWRGIVVSDANPIPFARQAHMCDIWLRRSHRCPLSIQFTDSKDGKFTVPLKLIEAAGTHRERWEHLKLHLVQPHLPAIEGPMPLLRYLDLEFYYPTDSLVFTKVPLLRTAVLDVVAASHVILPWPQLTSLTLRYVYLSECVPILRQTSSLLYCQLELFFVPEEDQHETDIALPCLESLAFIDAYNTPVTPYPNILIVPALRRLEIPELFLGPQPIVALASFISKSNSKLQEVSITGDRSVPEDSYRKAFPRIAKFSFSGQYLPAAEMSDEENSDPSDSE
ncbi:hypothetical protein B0H13DRAFT_222010 [Mycena leptocephala]|nr:hypothetical protein B0H13DRAFT_222010 [Mycena leptocephala]